jgi:hypothetical protein
LETLAMVSNLSSRFTLILTVDYIPDINESSNQAHRIPSDSSSRRPVEDILQSTPLHQQPSSLGSNTENSSGTSSSAQRENAQS